MRTLALTADRRLFIDNSGNIAQKRDLDAVMQDCETAMRAQAGEMFYNMDSGIPTRQTVWEVYNPLQFTAAGRVTLANVPGVVRVLSFTTDRKGDLFTYTAEIETTYGLGVLNG